SPVWTTSPMAIGGTTTDDTALHIHRAHFGRRPVYARRAAPTTGLHMIPHRTILRASIVAATVLAAGCDGQRSGPTVQEHFVAPMDKAGTTRVELTMRAGTLTVKGGAADLVAADFRYNVPEWKPSTEQRTSGSESEIQIEQGASPRPGGHTENQWD